MGAPEPEPELQPELEPLLQPPLQVWCAPMVLGSELAFRMLVRRHGVSLTYTPMIKADRLVAGAEDERRVLADVCAEDRPLALQLCGRDPAMLARAVQHALGGSQEPHIDAIDLNLGCPQRCAELGGWGSYLADEPTLAAACVRAMVAAAAPVPVWCKIRIATTAAETVAYALQLQAAGCALLAVHCRPRPNDRDVFHDTEPDYSHLAPLVSALQIPVVANGGIDNPEQGARVVQATGCHAVMTATSLLRCPRAFGCSKQQLEAESSCTVAIDVAREYLSLAERFPPPSALFISKHLRWIFREFLQPAYAAATSAAKVQRDQEKERRERERLVDGTTGTTHTDPPQPTPPPSRPDDSEERTAQIGWDDWRVRVWKFLAKPDLTETWQFAEVVRHIAAHHALAGGDATQLETAMSLKDIRLMRRRHNGEEVKAGGAADVDAEELGCLGLFDNET